MSAAGFEGGFIAAIVARPGNLRWFAVSRHHANRSGVCDVRSPDTKSRPDPLPVQPRRSAMVGTRHRWSPMTQIQETGEKVVANVERVIVGKHHEARLAMVALMCRGHLLIEDVPGTGKTVLA